MHDLGSNVRGVAGDDAEGAFGRCGDAGVSGCGIDKIPPGNLGTRELFRSVRTLSVRESIGDECTATVYFLES